MAAIANENVKAAYGTLREPPKAFLPSRLPPGMQTSG